MGPSVLRKKEVFTICTPIPVFIPRQLALDVLHNHSEVITLNPLVTGHRRINPPSTAPSEEHSNTWYEITERIQYIPGIGKMGSGEINFNGCFQDTPLGLQTHIYAPMNVDMRAQYRVAGDSGPREPGLEALGAPAEGLYLRADIEFESNIALVSFIRSQSKTAITEMVDRMVKKAEQLDADVLQSMIAGDRLQATEPKPQTLAPQAGPYGMPSPRHSPANSVSSFQQGYNSSNTAPRPSDAHELPTPPAPMQNFSRPSPSLRPAHGHELPASQPIPVFELPSPPVSTQQQQQTPQQYPLSDHKAPTTTYIELPGDESYNSNVSTTFTNQTPVSPPSPPSPAPNPYVQFSPYSKQASQFSPEQRQYAQLSPYVSPPLGGERRGSTASNKSDGLTNWQAARSYHQST